MPAGGVRVGKYPAECSDPGQLRQARRPSASRSRRRRQRRERSAARASARKGSAQTRYQGMTQGQGEDAAEEDDSPIARQRAARRRSATAAVGRERRPRTSASRRRDRTAVGAAVAARRSPSRLGTLQRRDERPWVPRSGSAPPKPRGRRAPRPRPRAPAPASARGRRVAPSTTIGATIAKRRLDRRGGDDQRAGRGVGPARGAGVASADQAPRRADQAGSAGDVLVEAADLRQRAAAGSGPSAASPGPGCAEAAGHRARRARPSPALETPTTTFHVPGPRPCGPVARAPRPRA